MKFANRQVEELPIGKLTAQQFLSLAIEASTSLGWVFGDVNKTGFIAYTNNGLCCWNAEVRLKIINGSAVIQSASRADEVIDVRENKKNLQNFISTFNSLKKSTSHDEFVPKYEQLRSNFSSN